MSLVFPTQGSTMRVSTSRVAIRHLTRRARDEEGPTETGWAPGSVDPFQPTTGEGSQTPPAHDNQGHPIDVPTFDAVKIPGYTWHQDPTRAHQKSANDTWAGIDIRSIDSRVAAWWDDLEKLIREYWSFQEISLTRSRNKIVFDVQHLMPLHVEIVGAPVAVKVYVGGASATFDKRTSLWEILMWIDGVARARI